MLTPDSNFQSKGAYNYLGIAEQIQRTALTCLRPFPLPGGRKENI